MWAINLFYHKSNIFPGHVFVQTELLCQSLKLVSSPFCISGALGVTVQKWKHEKLCLQCGSTFTFVCLSWDLDIRIPSRCQTVPNLLINLSRYHKDGVLLHKLWRINLFSFSYINQRRPGQAVHSPHHPWPTRGWLCSNNELFPARFGAQERQEFAFHWWDDEHNGKPCLPWSELFYCEGRGTMLQEGHREDFWFVAVPHLSPPLFRR